MVLSLATVPFTADFRYWNPQGLSRKIRLMNTEELAALANQLDEILDHGLEIDAVEWLANYVRGESAAGDGRTPRVDRAVATILDKAAKEATSAAHALMDAMGNDPLTHAELADEEVAAILDRQMPAILHDGFEEPDILQAFAMWRVVAINDEKRREEQKQFDKKTCDIWAEAARELETLLEDTADDLFDDEDEGEDDEMVTVRPTPATRILTKNPGLLSKGVDHAKLVNQLNKTGRNEPCPCDGKKKFKKCCGSNV
jgi:hypothetical protein